MAVKREGVVRQVSDVIRSTVADTAADLLPYVISTSLRRIVDSAPIVLLTTRPEIIAPAARAIVSNERTLAARTDDIARRPRYAVFCTESEHS